MKSSLKICLFIFNISLANIVLSQSSNTVFFPEEWTGEWSGQLDIKTSNGQSSEVGMTLNIKETETPGELKWDIMYSDNISKNYILKTIDPEKGIYKLDEDNSIILDFYYTGNTFYSTFSVQKNIIISRYHKQNGEIHFEVISSPMHSPNIKGSDYEETGQVDSYPVYAVQKAVLKKK